MSTARPRMAAPALVSRGGGGSAGSRSSAMRADDSRVSGENGRRTRGDTLTLNDPRELYEKRDQVQILDVREPYEWEAGHIEGSVHVPLAQVMGGQERGQLD